MNILNVDFLSELGSIDIINDYAICQLLRSKIHIWQCKSTVFAGYVNYYQQFTNHVKSHQWLCQVLWTHSHRHSFNCWSLLNLGLKILCIKCPWLFKLSSFVFELTILDKNRQWYQDMVVDDSRVEKPMFFGPKNSDLSLFQFF